MRPLIDCHGEAKPARDNRGMNKTLGGFMTAAALALGGCASLTGTTLDSARSEAKLSVDKALETAEGTAAFAQAKNQNVAVEVRVKHLPKPERLSPPGITYVVWVRPDRDEPAQNVGALAVDKDLSGTLSTLTPLHNFELFITAESTSQTQEPNGRPLLWTSYSL